MNKVITALALAVFVIGMAIRTSAQTPPKSGGKKSSDNAATGPKAQSNAAANHLQITKVMTQETVIGNVKMADRSFITSADCGHFACILTIEGSKQQVVEDGQPVGKAFDAINPATLALSSDGKHSFYEALTKEQEPVIVVDGVEKSIFTTPFFRQFIRLNLTVNPNWEQVNEKRAPGVTNFLILSPDWAHVAFVSRKLGNGSMVGVIAMEGQGDIVIETTDEDGPGDSPVFSPDGKIHEWLPDKVRQDGTLVAYSPDRTRKAYPFKRGEKWLAVVADTKKKEPNTEGKEYDEIGGLGIIFSADGKRVAYTARRGAKWVTVVNEVEGKEYDEIVAGSLAFSPDGNRIAYAARRGDNWYMVNGGVEGKPYSLIAHHSLVYSPDGKHVVYRAKPIHGTKFVTVVDDAEGKEYDGFFIGSTKEDNGVFKGSNFEFVFDDANRFHFLASRGDDVLRVNATIMTMKVPSK